MFQALQEFNAVRPKLLVVEGTEYKLWTGPSKPPHVRKEDHIVTEALSAEKLLVPDPNLLEHDYPRQGLVYGPRLTAHRPKKGASLLA